MDAYELTEALLAAGLPPESFQVAGVHEHTPRPLDFWFLRPGAGGWEIGPYERGRYEIREVHPTQAAATARLYQILTGRTAS